ncbi:MAG TPA: TIGR00730 family Rossman fold protein [Bacteroidia bacterium]|nr:TIGR00730 family Rossman fold protein [Bacteroidia bacterium]
MEKNFLKREEEKFLLGPRARWKDFKYTLSVVGQFIKGFRTLHFVGPSITVFGSARFTEEHTYYTIAKELSGKMSKLGFTIVTGGGPGIMEAANRGAKEAGGISIGCNIILPKEQYVNPYVDKFVNIEYFFVRKELLRKYSFAFIVMPGGFGTLDEFFETVTLIETKKIKNFPVVVMGIDYHKNLIEHLNNMVLNKTISKDDLTLILFTDSIDEAVDHIEKYAAINIKPKTTQKPLWILGEEKVVEK